MTALRWYWRLSPARTPWIRSGERSTCCGEQHPQVSPTARIHMELAACEIGANILKHARGGEPVRMRMEADVRDGIVRVDFTDDGHPAPVELDAVAMPTEMEGRGLALAVAVLDRLSFQRDARNWSLATSGHRLSGSPTNRAAAAALPTLGPWAGRLSSGCALAFSAGGGSLMPPGGPAPPPPCSFALSDPVRDGDTVTATVLSTGCAALAEPYSSVACLHPRRRCGDPMRTGSRRRSGGSRYRMRRV